MWFFEKNLREPLIGCLRRSWIIAFPAFKFRAALVSGRFPNICPGDALLCLPEYFFDVRIHRFAPIHGNVITVALVMVNAPVALQDIGLFAHRFECGRTGSASFRDCRDFLTLRGVQESVTSAPKPTVRNDGPAPNRTSFTHSERQGVKTLFVLTLSITTRNKRSSKEKKLEKAL
jgi:hypothetical protein